MARLLLNEWLTHGAANYRLSVDRQLTLLFLVSEIVKQRMTSRHPAVGAIAGQAKHNQAHE